MTVLENYIQTYFGVSHDDLEKISTYFNLIKLKKGGYGILGLGLMTNRFTEFFFEVGATGTGAIADRVAVRPKYANGLLVNVGVRFQFY